MKDGEKDPADIELAQQLFAESGIDPKDVTLELHVGSFYSKDYAELLAASYEATGMQVTI